MLKYTILLCMLLCAPVHEFVSSSHHKSQTIYWVNSENLSIEQIGVFALQSVLVEDTHKRSMVLNLVEMLLKLIVILICILLIVITPLLLIFSVIKEFRKLKICRKNLKLSFQSAKSGLMPNEPEKLKMKFRAIAASLFASSFGLVSWIGFSLSYMILGFKDMSNGFSAYFYFPIKIVETLFSEGNLNLNNVYGKSWIYMLGIVMLTVVFYLVGYAIGRSYSSEKIVHYKTHAFKTNEERLTT